jgi:uncharacterized protein YPO0396
MKNESLPLDFSVDESLSGFRLQRLEVFNWGTFDGRVWTLRADGRNALLTGDIGSGKSTLVDAVTTLLVPAHRVAYNKAAGAEARERSLRSYVLGHYKAARSDLGASGRPVALRGPNSYSVILAVFHNAGYDQTVTLAQVFWLKDPAQPLRLYAVAEKDLGIAADFADFGTDTAARLKEREAEQARSQLKLEQARALRAATQQRLDAPDFADHQQQFGLIEGWRAEALGEHQLSVESCDGREQDMRRWLQERIDADDKRQARLTEKIVRAMAEYKEAFKLETQEVDASVVAVGEYRSMLAQLQADDLPRFEARFKELLNENTIREVAHFQSQLHRERETIKERVARINESLTQIDYNPGRYIALEAQPATDADVRDFQTELRACTEGTLTGSDDAQYSEAKFLQVRRIIERFRGREGSAESDRRWAAKVTDVRQWFQFAASERWREDGSEHEHYADSGGKSGGQKEKLAYTILAASLAYQFGLEWGAARSRSFRFVVIDEAFGRGSDESAEYGLRLFKQLNLQLLIVTPLQKIHIIEPFVASVGFVHNEDGSSSKLRNLAIEEYRAQRGMADELGQRGLGDLRAERDAAA